MLKPPGPSEKPPFVQMMRSLGMAPDDWQVEVLLSEEKRVLLNCSRQAGKSTVAAILAMGQALFYPLTRVLIVSRSHRQAKELFRQIVFYHKLLGEKLLERRTAEELEFTNMSRIVSVPCKEETIRGFAHVDLLIIDEAARVPDDLYKAVRPMLAITKGRLICLSTPYGKRGFFWDAWANQGDDWRRISVRGDQLPRIGTEFLEAERRGLGEAWFRQEYCCSFESVEGLVYPGFEVCLATRDGEPEGRRVGGIDFGFRNPFAAVWGVLDREDVLWLTGERYVTNKPISEHARHLPKNVEWFSDPSGAEARAELRRAGFCVREGMNAIREGIAAVTARIEDGSLKVLAGRCPNLVREAGLYRYAAERVSETPVDADNHALAALRYLIGTLDKKRMSRIRGESPAPPKVDPSDDERLWRRFGAA